MNYSTAMIQLPLVRDGGARQSMRTPEDVCAVCDDLRDLAQEAFHVLVVDAKNRLANRHMVSLGIVDASLVHPREVFRPVILEGAVAMILVHNHPSGDPTPSAQDIRITRQMIEVGRIMEMKVLDHIIIGRASDSGPGFLSLREQGLCDFS